jgi:hypothetical protein
MFMEVCYRHRSRLDPSPFIVRTVIGFRHIDIALPVEDKVGSTEGTVSARRLVPHRNVRGDLRSTSHLSSLTGPYASSNGNLVDVSPSGHMSTMANLT